MASYGVESQGGMSSQTLNQISTAVAQGLRLSQRNQPVGNPGEKRRQDFLSGIQKEAALARAL